MRQRAVAVHAVGGDASKFISRRESAGMTMPISSAIRCPRCSRLLGVRVGAHVELRRAGELVARFERGVLSCGRCREVVTVEPAAARYTMRAAVSPG